MTFWFCIWFYFLNATLVWHVATALCNIHKMRTGKKKVNCLDVMMCLLKVCSLPPFLVLSEFRVTKPYVLCHKKRVPSWWLLLVSVKLWIDGVLCQDSLWIKKIFCFIKCCLGSCMNNNNHEISQKTKKSPKTLKKQESNLESRNLVVLWSSIATVKTFYAD